MSKINGRFSIYTIKDKQYIIQKQHRFTMLFLYLSVHIYAIEILVEECLCSIELFGSILLDAF